MKKFIIASGILGDVYSIKLRRGGFQRRDDWQTLMRFGGGLAIVPLAAAVCLGIARAPRGVGPTSQRARRSISVTCGWKRRAPCSRASSMNRASSFSRAGA